MAPRAEKRQLKSPAKRTAGDGCFFPNEAVRILGLERVDYRQLRRLFELVRTASGTSFTGRKWSRFSFRDLAALRVAIDLAGGIEALRSGRRLRLKPIEDACRVLRDRFGLSSPLTQARLYREGRVVVAELAGQHFVPQSGQLVFGTLRGAVRRHVETHDSVKAHATVLKHLEVDEAGLRVVRVKKANMCARTRGRDAQPRVVIA